MKTLPFRFAAVHFSWILNAASLLLLLWLLTNCQKDTEVTPGTSSTSVTSASGTSTTSSSVGLPDTSFVSIPANTTFSFATSVTNSGTGESSPITAQYYLNKYLVTNAQYKAFCDATSHKLPAYWTNSSFPPGKADHPVLYVSLTDAQAYCTWLGTQISGYTFRVPTEAEWENAAAGPSKYTWPWGNTEGSSYTNKVLTSNYNYNGVCSAYYLANSGSTLATNMNSSSADYNKPVALSLILSINANGGVMGWKDETNIKGFAYTDLFNTLVTAGGYTTPVRAYPRGRSYYGLYDMAGNAWVWTSSTITANNGGEKGQTVYAIRGGSWYANGSSCKTTYRGEGRAASGAFNSVGFRVAATKN